jgi:hypothetical protein
MLNSSIISACTSMAAISKLNPQIIDSPKKISPIYDLSPIHSTFSSLNKMKIINQTYTK